MTARRRRAGVRSFGLGQLLEHRLVELGLGQQLLEPAVLDLELPQALGLGRLHPPVLVPPPVPGGLGDLEVADHLGQILALVEQPLALTELADDRLGSVDGVASSWSVLLPIMLGVGLPQLVDRYPGAPSPAIVLRRLNEPNQGTCPAAHLQPRASSISESTVRLS
jgi:hypothetical protein